MNQTAMWGLDVGWNPALPCLTTFEILGRAEHTEKQTLSTTDPFQHPLAFPEHPHFSLLLITLWESITPLGAFPDQLISEPKQNNTI